MSVIYRFQQYLLLLTNIAARLLTMATGAEQAQEEKAKGNAAFQKGDFDVAVKHFTKAIELSPSDAVLYSNRSGAYASLKDFEKALKDAETCVKLKPDWAKVKGSIKANNNFSSSQ